MTRATGDLSGDVLRRATLHAALAEPVRLAIVDRLALTDLSPGDLATKFRLGTNLLAHHLRVLEQAGAVRRVRSEGDRRRSYVQLCLEDPAVLALTSPTAAGSTARPERVVFVCTQNSARSQLAAALWRARTRAVPATSAGTRPAVRVSPGAVEVGRRHGLRLGRARPHHLDDVREPGDLLVAVCDNAYEELAAPAGAQLHWAVPDPARAGTADAFDVAYRELAPRVDRLLESVTAAGLSH